MDFHRCNLLAPYQCTFYVRYSDSHDIGHLVWTDHVVAFYTIGKQLGVCRNARQMYEEFECYFEEWLYRLGFQLTGHYQLKVNDCTGLGWVEARKENLKRAKFIILFILTSSWTQYDRILIWSWSHPDLIQVISMENPSFIISWSKAHPNPLLIPNPRQVLNPS